MSVEIQAEIIGIIGTLMGIVLGWILNNLSQKGNLHIYIKKWEPSLRKRDKYGGFTVCDSFDDAEYYHYELSIDAYNSSRDTRIMRDVCLVFMNKNKALFKSVPYDDKTKRTNVITYYDEVSGINIPAKTVINVDLHSGINESNEEWEKLTQYDKVLLEYIDEKNKHKRVKIANKIILNR